MYFTDTLNNLLAKEVRGGGVGGARGGGGGRRSQDGEMAPEGS